jgi:hypothetical protein
LSTTSPRAWKLVVGHHPIYSAASHGDTIPLQNDLLPILHKVLCHCSRRCVETLHGRHRIASNPTSCSTTFMRTLAAMIMRCNIFRCHSMDTTCTNSFQVVVAINPVHTISEMRATMPITTSSSMERAQWVTWMSLYVRQPRPRPTDTRHRLMRALAPCIVP